MLHKAASYEILDVVQFLLKNGLNPNLRNRAQETPLLRALVNKKEISNNNKEVIKILLAHGADIYTSTSRGNTIAKACIEYDKACPTHQNNIPGLKYLLELGYNANQCDERGNTALSAAIRNNSVKALKLLLSYNAEIYTKTKNSTEVRFRHILDLIDNEGEGKKELITELVKYGCLFSKRQQDIATNANEGAPTAKTMGEITFEECNSESLNEIIHLTNALVGNLNHDLTNIKFDLNQDNINLFSARFKNILLYIGSDKTIFEIKTAIADNASIPAELKEAIITQIDYVNEFNQQVIDLVSVAVNDGMPMDLYTLKNMDPDDELLNLNDEDSPVTKLLNYYKENAGIEPTNFLKMLREADSEDSNTKFARDLYAANIKILSNNLAALSGKLQDQEGLILQSLCSFILPKETKDAIKVKVAEYKAAKLDRFIAKCKSEYLTSEDTNEQTDDNDEGTEGEEENKKTDSTKKEEKSNLLDDNSSELEKDLDNLDLGGEAPATDVDEI